MMQYRPERVRTAIAGGVDLTALAPSPGAAESRPPSSFLREADWDGFARTLAFDTPADWQEQIRRENDPLAIAAILDVEITLAFDPTQFPGLVYVGDGEAFAQTTAEIAALLGLPCEVLPTGGHIETFRASKVVCPIVEKVLDTESPRER
jgi:hypothetical protein